MPLIATCRVPSGRATVESVPLTPLPAVGFPPASARSGGQVVAQASMHEIDPGCSRVRWYRVSPVLSTRMSPRSELLATFTVVPPAAPPVLAFVDDLPQPPATTMVTS